MSNTPELIQWLPKETVMGSKFTAAAATFQRKSMTLKHMGSSTPATLIQF
jgi:hypothetical protein